MKKRLLMILLGVVLTLSVMIPVSAKESANENVGAMERWDDRGLFDGLKNLHKNPNASLSKLEFAALVNQLFGYSNGIEKESVIEIAQAAGYWDEVFGEEDQKNSAIKGKDAREILEYLLPEQTVGNELFKGLEANTPLKRIDAVELIDQHIKGYFYKSKTYKNKEISGNALINHHGVTLTNSTIDGDLFITAGAIPGNITLDNVTVSGTVYIADAVQNSVKTIHSNIKQVIVYKRGESSSDWTLVWADEFIADEIDREKWDYDLGNWIVDENGAGIASGWGNNELEYYTDSPENSYIEDGKLVIKAQKEDEPVTDEFGTYHYTSAKLKTKDLFSKKYGKFEASIKLPEGQGYWPAFWMMPEDDVYGTWPASGEIDIMEAAGRDTTKIGGTIHYGEQYPNNTYKGTEYHFPEGETITDFHTYGIEWEPGEIRWYVDGELYQTLNNWFSQGPDEAIKYAFPAPFDQEFYMILNLAVGGWYGGEPDETTTFPGKMEVDYVRVYELTGRDYLEPTEPTVEKIELPEDAKQPLEDGNLVYDNAYTKPITVIDSGDMALDPIYWNFLYLPDFAGVGAISVEELDGVPFAKTEITNAGNALWSLQLIQKVAIVESGRYKVSFDAKSDTDRNMMTKVSGGAERGYANYSGEQTIALTDTVSSYEYTFTMQQDTDLAARLEFNMGANGTAPIWIGNVRVEEIAPEDPTEATKTPLADGNHIYNGTFDQGDMTRLAFWELEATPDASAQMSVSEQTRELKVAIENGGEAATDVKVKQTKLQLLKGNTYELSFDARAEGAQSVEVAFVSEDGSINYAESEAIALTDQMANYTVEFTMPTDVTDMFGQLHFMLGGQNGDVYVDNVELIQTSTYIDYSGVDLYPLQNGDFSAGLDSWGSYIHFDAVANVSEQNEEFLVSISSGGNETWSVLAEQGNMAFSKGVTYVLAFDARSTVDRNIEVTIENAGYHRYLSEVVSLSNEMTHHQYEFVMPADDTVALKYLMGQFAEAHEIVIDNVILQVKGADEL